MKIVFMGTPDFSVPVLEALVKAGHQVEAVVTQPDKPKGRRESGSDDSGKRKSHGAWNSGLSASEGTGTGICRSVKRIKTRCDGSCCLWTDSSKGGPGYSSLTAVSMFMHPCFRSTAVRLRSSGW